MRCANLAIIMTETDNEFDREAYLERINLAGLIPVSETGLARLCRAQLFAIPFENMDIQLGRKLDLRPGSLFRKIVMGRRGGYCFELNTLLRTALLEFGFEARSGLARVRRRGEITGRSHLITLVRDRGRDFIVDVGFGASGLRAPMPLESGHMTVQDGFRFRLIEDGEFGHLLQIEHQGEWQDLYSFDTCVVTDADIQMSNHFTETHPSSTFVRFRVAHLPNPGGATSLLNHSLRLTQDGCEELQHIEGGAGYMEMLSDCFGIRLDASYEDFKAVSD